jgi:hypothetical protein
VKVYLVLENAFDETIVNDVFANKDKAEAYAKKLQNETSSKYATFYVEEWDVTE